MHEKSLEPLSAMMDGEIEAFELRRVVERIASSSELKSKWDRYHLAQDIIQGREAQLSTSDNKIDLVSRVSAAIDAEPSYNIKTIEQAEKSVTNKDQVTGIVEKNSWWKPVASMAVAASVTAVVLLSSQQFLPNTGVSMVNVVASSGQADNGIPPSRFGDELATVSATVQNKQADVLRAAQGMDKYIQQHKDLSLSQSTQWQVNWLPDGFSKVKENVTASAETLLFKKDNSMISINIESIGSQTASHGVLNTNDLLAYGVNKNDKFVTVVGKLSPQQAAKIAASVSIKN